ncbi:MAG TPA: hypothetical protein VGP93_03960, partial [Polyangiaceae bacterium]|nr:hypothetical protein [Polyangiaceae bacterium]
PAQPPTVRPKGTTFLGGLRVGYAYPFDETFGLWPRAGISYATSSAHIVVTDPAANTNTTIKLSSNYIDFDAEVLAVISPVEHLAFMIGPFLDLGLGGKAIAKTASLEDRRNAKLTSLGLLVNAVGYY